jgi:hypothetical protein
MIRLALAGPRYLGTALGVVAALFNLGVAAAYNYVAPAVQESWERRRKRAAAAREQEAADPDAMRQEGEERPDVRKESPL